MEQFKIGSKVDYSGGNFMKNGIITSIDPDNNRVFVEWPQHGVSSIHISNLVLI